MEFNQITIPCKRRNDEWFTIRGIGDIHEGAAGSDKPALRKVVNEVREDDHSWWIGMGDYGEFIQRKDKRWQARALERKYRQGSIDNICQEQIDCINVELYPIADKCLGILDGNHELKIFEEYGHSITYEMWKCFNDIKAGELPKGQPKDAVLNPDTYKNPKVRRLYDAAVIRITFTHKTKGRYDWQKSFDIYATHSNIAGSRPGSKVNRIEGILKDWPTVDAVLTAHGHAMPVVPYTAQGFNRYGKLVDFKKRGIQTGSFLRTYVEGANGYGERAGYSPCEIGTPKLQFNPATEDIRVIV